MRTLARKQLCYFLDGLQEDTTAGCMMVEKVSAWYNVRLWFVVDAHSHGFVRHAQALRTMLRSSSLDMPSNIERQGFKRVLRRRSLSWLKVSVFSHLSVFPFEHARFSPHLCLG